MATYTGLLVSSGGNLYELTSSGGLTLVNSSSLGFSLGAITQGSQSSSQSKIWALNSAGTDLYLIALQSANPQIATNHKGSLGVTGVGLAYLGGTLYTMVYNSSTTHYDLYTVSQTNGAASLSQSTLLGVLDNLTTNGTDLLPTETASNGGYLVKLSTGGLLGSSTNYEYSPGSFVNCDLAAFDGTNFWLFDNSSLKLSDGPWAQGTNVTVTVDATLNTTYNGMCWGYVPF